MLAGCASRDLLTASKRTEYFPPPESQGGWRKLDTPEDIRRRAGMDPAKLREIVARHTEGRDLGFLGEPRINVLLLNLGLIGTPNAGKR